jgi:hypothetical protein
VRSVLGVERAEALRSARRRGQQRFELLRSLVEDESKPLAPRVAGCILLYAQPITRILTLQLDDVVRQDDAVLFLFGTPPSSVPSPFAGLLLRQVGARVTAGGRPQTFDADSMLRVKGPRIQAST